MSGSPSKNNVVHERIIAQECRWGGFSLSTWTGTTVGSAPISRLSAMRKTAMCYCGYTHLSKSTKGGDMSSMWMLIILMRMDMQRIRTNADAIGSVDAIILPLSLSTYTTGSPADPTAGTSSQFRYDVPRGTMWSNKALPLSRYGMNGICRLHVDGSQGLKIVVNVWTQHRYTVVLLFYLLSNELICNEGDADVYVCSLCR